MHNYWIINSTLCLRSTQIGINVLKLPQNCIGYTKQLQYSTVLFPDIRKVSEEIMLTPLIASLNITENVISVIDDVNIMHS